MLRDLVLDAAPGVGESIKFSSLCYSVPDAPFGVIGGNVCMISVRDGGVSLGFIQGAELPDPAGLLTGSAKAKRGGPYPLRGRGPPASRSAAGVDRRLAPARIGAVRGPPLRGPGTARTHTPYDPLPEPRLRPLIAGGSEMKKVLVGGGKVGKSVAELLLAR